MKTILIINLLIVAIIAAKNDENSEIQNTISKDVDDLISASVIPKSLIKTVQKIINIKNQTEKDKTICDSCNNVINKVLVYRRKGANRSSMATYLKKLCNTFTDFGNIGCDGYIDITIDTLLFIIDNKRNLTSERACAIYFQAQKCIDPGADKWNIPLPPPAETLYHKSKNSGSLLKILHLTDIHFDPLYQPGSNAKCKEFLCCHNGTPATPQDAAGFWGDYNVCDMPWHSVKKLVNYVQENHEKIDLVYFTGDIISHIGYATTRHHNTETIKDIYNLFRKQFKNVTVYPILGNHEPHPTDFYSPNDIWNTQVSTKWVLELVARQWSHWLPQNVTETLLQGGFYTVLVKPGFRIIGLNSNVCFTSNIWLIYEDNDPYDQLKWLVDVLTEAEKNNEHVHILSHIPPGDIQCQKQWSFQFRRIINRFAKTVSAQFNGHTHLDELRVFYDMEKKNEKQVVNVAFNGGSFTTFVGLNPNYRLYDVNAANYMVENYAHYTYNLTESNAKSANATNPDWYKLYSFKEAYGLQDLTLPSLGNLVDRMGKNKTLMEQYFRFQVRDSDVQMKIGCNDGCLNKLHCTITAVEANESFLC